MEPIKVGDLVMIVKVRECCPEHTAWGLPYRVIRIQHGRFRCSFCNKEHDRKLTIAWGSGTVGADLLRIKKIPPFPELESEKRDEEITA